MPRVALTRAPAVARVNRNATARRRRIRRMPRRRASDGLRAPAVGTEAVAVAGPGTRALTTGFFRCCAAGTVAVTVCGRRTGLPGDCFGLAVFGAEEVSVPGFGAVVFAEPSVPGLDGAVFFAATPT